MLCPPLAMQLSKECRDLMDRIFEVDEALRITIPEIQAHPWYTEPLLPCYRAAEAQIAKEQAHLEGRQALKHVDAVRRPPGFRL